MYPATETKRIASGIQKLKRKKRKKKLAGFSQELEKFRMNF